MSQVEKLAEAGNPEDDSDARPRIVQFAAATAGASPGRCRSTLRDAPRDVRPFNELREASKALQDREVVRLARPSEMGWFTPRVGLGHIPEPGIGGPATAVPYRALAAHRLTCGGSCRRSKPTQPRVAIGRLERPSGRSSVDRLLGRGQAEGSPAVRSADGEAQTSGSGRPAPHPALWGVGLRCRCHRSRPSPGGGDLSRRSYPGDTVTR